MRGTCLCGQIAFQIDGALSDMYQCHCSLCRKQSGSSSNAAIVVDASNFRWLAGAGQISSYVRTTGFRSDFCARCGSPVPNPLLDSFYYWVPAGLLDGDADFKIAAHLFVTSKATWDQIPATGTHYETMPELAAFIRSLRHLIA